jgi:FdhD protein
LNSGNPVRKYQGLKVVPDAILPVNDYLTVEEAMAITINGKSFTVTMRTPGDELELVRGLLYSEDIYRNKEVNPEVLEMEKNEMGYISKVHLQIPVESLGNGYKNSRSLLSVSSCGICGKQELIDIVPEAQIDTGKLKIGLPEITKMYAILEKGQVQFEKSGGIHAAAIFNKQHEILSLKEDIGRHNAVDKAIGDLLLAKNIKRAEFMLVSGRVSYEIITKAFAARIPFLAAVSAPSSLAVDYAKELGITLMGFCREKKFTVYSHVERIIQ